jgi:hypothetical protein
MWGAPVRRGRSYAKAQRAAVSSRIVITMRFIAPYENENRPGAYYFPPTAWAKL